MPVINILIRLRQVYTVIKGIPHYDGECDRLNDAQGPAKRLETGHQQEQYPNDGSKHTDQNSPITRKKSYQHHTQQEGDDDTIDCSINSYYFSVNSDPVFAGMVS